MYILSSLYYNMPSIYTDFRSDLVKIKIQNPSSETLKFSGDDEIYQ